MILPIGTIIEVTPRGAIIREAHGIHLRSLEIFDPSQIGSIQWEVIKDPRGWGKKNARYEPDLEQDKIIGYPESKEYAHMVLERWDSE